MTLGVHSEPELLELAKFTIRAALLDSFYQMTTGLSI